MTIVRFGLGAILGIAIAAFLVTYGNSFETNVLWLLSAIFVTNCVGYKD